MALTAFSAPALGQVAEIVVVPVGEGEGLGPTTTVAEAVVKELNRGKKDPVARLGYPAPPALTASHADTKKAAAFLERALSAYQNMDFDKCADMAQKALDVHKQIMKGGATSEGYVKALHMLAAAALFADRIKVANKLMNDAYLFDPRAPSRKIFSPQVQNLFKQIQADPPADGTLKISSTPLSLVWFNSTLHGLARGPAVKRAGLYLLRFFAPGAEIRQRWIRIHPNQEREIVVMLNKAENPEPQVIADLRQEVGGERPGPAVQQIGLDMAASQVIVVTTDQSCAMERCKVGLHWVKDDSWYRQKELSFSGDGVQVAAAFVGRKIIRKLPKKPAIAAVAGGCTMNSQCSFKEQCINGRCVKPTPLTRKWWFWTLVGVGVVAVTVAIAAPLSSPAGPVIEVR